MSNDNVVNFPTPDTEQQKTELAAKQLFYIAGAVNGLIKTALQAAGFRVEVTECGHGVPAVVLHHDLDEPNEETVVAKLAEVYGEQGARAIASLIGKLTGADLMEQPRGQLEFAMRFPKIWEAAMSEDADVKHVWQEAAVDTFSRLTKTTEE